MLRLRSLCIIAALAALTGCAASSTSRVATFASPEVIIAPPCRILVVPFEAPACSAEGSLIVTEAVTLALKGALRADVTTASPRDERLMAESALCQRGRVDVAALIEARKATLADAFLFGSITDYKPYEPPLLGLKLRMLSAHTGEVLWAAEGIFDARRQDVRNAVEDYFRRSGLRDKLYGVDWIFMSPKQYATFVAEQMFLPLKDQVEARQRQVARKSR